MAAEGVNVTPDTAAAERVRSAVLGLAVFLVALTLFWPATRFEFILFDDPLHVTENPYVSSGLSAASVRWAFNIGYGGYWIPLTWLSHMLDVELFGLDPGVHHRTNVVLHALNGLLLFLVLRRLSDGGRAGGRPWIAALVAAVFVVHPLRIESVVWVAERKDLLSALFGLGALLAYLRYGRSPRVSSYVGALVLLALSLAAKPMLVTLPLLLLLLDHWPLARLDWTALRLPHERRRVVWPVLEKLPLFALAGIVGWLTLLAQRVDGSLSSLASLSLKLRLGNALVAAAAYLVGLVRPTPLAFFYPYPFPGWPAWKVFGAGMLLVLITAFVVARARRYPWLGVGWLWYLVSLIPVIGLVQVGMQARADRFTYLPHVGLCLAAVPAVALWVRGGPWRRRGAVLAGTLAVFVLAAVSLSELRHWRDTVRLFTRATEVTRNNYLAHHGLSLEYAARGEIDRAISHAAEAVRIHPGFYDAHAHLGYCLSRRGRVAEAITALHAAARLRPDAAGSYLNLGATYIQAGRPREAIEVLRQAVALDPGLAAAYVNLGVAHDGIGDEEGALAAYESALLLDGNLFEGRLFMGKLQARRGAYDEAQRHLSAAAALRPRDPAAHVALALLDLQRGDRPAAEARQRLLESLDPASAQIILRQLRGSKPE